MQSKVKTKVLSQAEGKSHEETRGSIEASTGEIESKHQLFVESQPQIRRARGLD